MLERRGSRFVVEALFLAALTVALALAHLDAIEIVGAMVAGWIVVAGIEWAAWRGEPHFGSGLPPRYYLPRVELPPTQPLEQVVHGYPDAGHDEAPTWIASAALRAEVLGQWPLAGPVRHEPDEDDEPEFVDASKPGADPWMVAALPARPLDEEARAVPVLKARPNGRTARYSLDPLGEPASRRRFGRGQSAQRETVEVTARPSGPRPLPGAAG